MVRQQRMLPWESKTKSRDKRDWELHHCWGLQPPQPLRILVHPFLVLGAVTLATVDREVLVAPQPKLKEEQKTCNKPTRFCSLVYGSNPCQYRMIVRVKLSTE